MIISLKILKLPGPGSDCRRSMITFVKTSRRENAVSQAHIKHGCAIIMNWSNTFVQCAFDQNWVNLHISRGQMAVHRTSDNYSP